MPDLDLDAIEARANAAMLSPTGQQYDAGVVLSTDVPALVAALREARAGWYQNRDKADLCDAMIAERDEARAATARVRALCAGADDSEYTTVFAAAVLAALDARDDPSATTTIPIDVAREHAWLANHALEMLVDTGDGTYHPIADALAKVRDLLDPSATTEGGAS